MNNYTRIVLYIITSLSSITIFLSTILFYVMILAFAIALVIIDPSSINHIPSSPTNSTIDNTASSNHHLQHAVVLNPIHVQSLQEMESTYRQYFIDFVLKVMSLSSKQPDSLSHISYDTPTGIPSPSSIYTDVYTLALYIIAC